MANECENGGDADGTATHAAYEHVPCPCLIIDEGAVCLAANAAARRLFNDGSDTITGRDLSDQLTGASGESFTGVLRVEADDGSADLPVFLAPPQPRSAPLSGVLRRDIQPGQHLLSLANSSESVVAELARRERRQQLVGELGQFALGDATIEQICQRSVEYVGPPLELDTCVFYPSVDQELELDAHASWHALDDSPKPVRVSNEEAHAFRKATTADGEPTVIPDVSELSDGTVRDVLERAGARSAIMVSIASRGERLGFLVGASSHAVNIGQSRINFLRTVGQILGQAISSKLDLQRLKESRRRLELALRMGSLSQFEWDVTRGLIEFDAQMARNLGVEHEQMPRAVDASFGWIHVDDRDETRDAVDRVIRGECDEYEVYVRMKGGGGEWRWQLSRGRAVERDEMGQATRIVGFQQDVHDRVVAELGRAELEDRLRQSQKMEALGRLAGGIAHDFNNLLTAISGYAELVHTQVQGSALAEDVNEIVIASERAERLTNRLLSLGRRKHLRSTVVDFNEIVRDFEKMLDRILGEDVELSTRLTEGIWHVEIERSAVEQVLLNLIVNARDAMPRGGMLTIETDNYDLLPEPAERFPDLSPGEYVRLRVGDTGIGMDEETLDKAIEPFFTTKDLGDGTGLGLATVYGVVRQVGGSMLIDSSPGQGTSVELLFPRTHQQLSEIDMTNEPRTTSDVSGERILVVEDDKVLLNLVFRVLSEEGYDVTAYENPLEAWSWLENEADGLDMVLTDVVMPGMRGTEVAKRAMETFPSVNVLFMSGYTADAEFSSWQERSNVGILRKPFTPSYLVGRVQDNLAGHNSNAG